MGCMLWSAVFSVPMVSGFTVSHEAPGLSRDGLSLLLPGPLPSSAEPLYCTVAFEEDYLRQMQKTAATSGLFRREFSPGRPMFLSCRSCYQFSQVKFCGLLTELPLEGRLGLRLYCSLPGTIQVLFASWLVRSVFKL